jgi:hypothetical protein
VNVDNNEWVVVFLPHGVGSSNFVGFVCELLLNSSSMFNNDECPRVHTCVWLMPKSLISSPSWEHPDSVDVSTLVMSLCSRA